MFRTYVAGLEGEPGTAAADLRTQLARYLETGARPNAPSMLRRIAELEMRAGEWGNVQTTIEEALRLVGGGCDPYAAPSIYRLLGEYFARAASRDLDEARRALRTSVDIASSQGARSERLLAAAALARLPNQSPDTLSEARNILRSALSGLESETEFPAVAEAQSLLAEFEKATFPGAI